MFAGETLSPQVVSLPGHLNRRSRQSEPGGAERGDGQPPLVDQMPDQRLETPHRGPGLAVIGIRVHRPVEILVAGQVDAAEEDLPAPKMAANWTAQAETVAP